MLELLGIIVLAIMLIRESIQRRDAQNFSKWMKDNAPDRYISGNELKSWINTYNNSKRR